MAIDMDESSATVVEAPPRGPGPGRLSLRRLRRVLATTLLLLAAGGCEDGPDPASVPEVRPTDDELREALDLRTLGEIPYPPDNPLVPERVELGRLLFFDPILSGEGDVACATCHLPEHTFTDARQFAVGVGGEGLGPARSEGVSAVSGEPVPPTRRNTTTVFNTGLAPGPDGQPSHEAPLFWDGRALGLEDQALQPLVVREEMRGDALAGPDETVVDSLVARLRGLSAYVERFSGAFPGEASSAFDPGAVSRSTLARALAAYQRELVTRDAPYDRWVEGDDDALTDRQKEGMELFFTRARCFVCHTDPLFGSFGFFVTGAPSAGRGGTVISGDDTGREEHTGDPADRYAFRVPSLRNVELTAPYMHSGVFQTLDEVVRFYDAGARPRHPEVSDDELSSVLREPLGLEAEERDALVAFLKALTDPGTGLDPELITAPDAVPSGLSYTGESADFIVMANVAAGAWHGCAVSGRGSGVPNGTVYCWGRNDQGQLGIGTASPNDVRLLPVRVSAPAADGGLGGGETEEEPFFYLAAGRGYTCGRTIHSDMFCWGGGAVGGGHLRPHQVGEGRTWRRLDGGDDHVCALTAEDRLLCWGDNVHGQLGTGTTTPSVEPREVPGGPWASVSAGARHTCAITLAGETLCWGDGSDGQLGSGPDSGGSLRPIPVAGEARFVDVAAGGTHSCGVDDGGRAWCWGDNATGQLGVPLVVTGSAVPEPVDTDVRFRSIDGGPEHTCAASAEREAWCWGGNGEGQLGIDALTPRIQPSPVRVRTDRRFSELSVGRHHTCAIEGARGWCWGGNAFGQVGNGGTEPNLVPRVVVGKP